MLPTTFWAGRLNSGVRHQVNYMTHLVYWLPFVCATLHIFEEFVWPGGFLEWYRSYRPEIAASLTPRFVIVVNSILLGAGFALGWLGPAWGRGISLWLILAALLAANAIFHIIGVLRLRRYSPGVVTGVFLYIPLCIWSYWYFISHGDASWRFAITSFVIGSSYQFWSILNHHRRSAASAGA
jgi:hypothetical protein